MQPPDALPAWTALAAIPLWIAAIRIIRHDIRNRNKED